MFNSPLNPPKLIRERQTKNTQSLLTDHTFEGIDFSEVARNNEQGSYKNKKIQKIQSNLRLLKVSKNNIKKLQQKTPMKSLLSYYSDNSSKIQSILTTPQNEMNESTAENSIDETIRDTMSQLTLSYFNSP